MAEQEPQQEHQHGQMDISRHQETFDGFLRIVFWHIVGIPVFLIFLALLNA